MTARIIPITTNTTIATCIQIHVGDTDQEPTQQHRHSHADSCAGHGHDAVHGANHRRGGRRRRPGRQGAGHPAAVVVYDLQNSRDEQFGVLASSGAHKPSFADLAQALASPFGRVRNVTLALRRRGRAVLASGSARSATTCSCKPSPAAPALPRAVHDG